MDKLMTGVTIGVIIVYAIIFVVDPNRVWQNKIVEAGHGEYNRTTGEFQFLPECKKEN